MEVILKEDIETLGHRGDIVKVADGYGRNYLLPKKLAMEATAANKAVIEQMKASAVRRSAKEKAEAEQLVAQLDAVECTNASSSSSLAKRWPQAAVSVSMWIEFMRSPMRWPRFAPWVWK